MNLGATQLLIVFGVLLLLVGARTIPDLAPSLGEAQRDFRPGAGDDTDQPDPSALEGAGGRQPPVS